MNTTDEIRNQVISLVRNFVKKDVLPVARKYEYEDNYPHELIEKMKEMGLFGITMVNELGPLSFHTIIGKEQVQKESFPLGQQDDGLIKYDYQF